MPSATECVGVTLTSIRPDGLQTAFELREGQGAGDTADVAAPLGALLRVSAVVGDDVRDADAAARAQHACDLREYSGLVRGQVDDAVADHDVDRVGRQRDLLDVALEQLDVRGARLGDVALARASISSVMSRPNTRPDGPTRLADSSTSMPPPEPRSSTRSPSCSSATAVGLPQPSEAITAASGSSSRSSAVYSSEPIPSPGAQHASFGIRVRPTRSVRSGPVPGRGSAQS